MRLNRIYTRRGDTGTTQMAGGRKVSKSSILVAAYGELDELNSQIGLCRAQLAQTMPPLPVDGLLAKVQEHLFEMGGILAFDPNHEDLAARLAGFHQPQGDGRDRRVALLEGEIDRLNRDLPEVKGFVLPAGSLGAAQLHVARTCCRRLERALVTRHLEAAVDSVVLAYINRLSDLLFVLARWVNVQQGLPEATWQPPASG